MSFILELKTLIFLRLAVVEDEINLLEWSANSKCGGGSGILIEKQLRRLYLKDDLKFFNIEDPYQNKNRWNNYL